MELCVFAARDAKAGYFHAPFFCRNNVEALRMFQKAASDPNRHIPREDMQLFAFGKWDDNSGKFELLDVPDLLATASDFPEDK